MKRAMKKIGAMLLLLAVVIAVVGGCGYLIAGAKYVPAVCVLMLGACAWPVVVRVWTYWTKG